MKFGIIALSILSPLEFDKRIISCKKKLIETGRDVLLREMC